MGKCIKGKGLRIKVRSSNLIFGAIMSLIFSGLKRLAGYKETDPVEFNETRLDQVTEISTKGFDQKQRKVVVTLKDESEVIEKNTIELFTRNENCCENSNKQFVVNNAIYFIPRIMLGF